MAEIIAPWANLRLRDRIKPGVRVLFVGINPGVRSAVTGHHFAGYSNRFWKLVWESRLVPEPLTHLDDDRLHQWGFGITNLISRPSPGIDDLRPAEYEAGWSALARKIRKYRPETVAFVGVTLYRAILPLLDPAPETRALRQAQGRPEHSRRTAGTRLDSLIGFRPETIHGARVFVLPNPSGRNAHFSYAEMLAAFKKLKRAMRSERSSL
jgi:double-stranded uracil-DNA glycosylase